MTCPHESRKLTPTCPACTEEALYREVYAMVQGQLKEKHERAMAQLVQTIEDQRTEGRRQSAKISEQQRVIDRLMGER